MDPIKVPDLTAFILSLLRPTSEVRQTTPTATKVELSSSTQTASESESLDTLAPELLQLIASHLPITTILPLRRTCHYINTAIPTDQSFWRSQLLNLAFLPWLWDLDVAALSHHAAPPGQAWDWERICCQLKKPVFDRVEAAKAFRKGPKRMYGERMEEPKGLTLAERRELSEGMRDAPAGLWNRRRIWKICQDVMDGPTGQDELDSSEDDSSGEDETEDEEHGDSVDDEVWRLIAGR